MTTQKNQRSVINLLINDTVNDCQVELCQNISRSRNPSRDQLEDPTHGIGGGGGGGGGEGGKGEGGKEGGGKEGGGGEEEIQDSTKHSAISGDLGQV